MILRGEFALSIGKILAVTLSAVGNDGAEVGNYRQAAGALLAGGPLRLHGVDQSPPAPGGFGFPAVLTDFAAGFAGPCDLAGGGSLTRAAVGDGGGVHTGLRVCGMRCGLAGFLNECEIPIYWVVHGRDCFGDFPG